MAFVFSQNLTERRIKMMRRVKRILAVCTAFILCLGMTACGGSSDTSDKEEFVVGMECNYAPFNWTTTEESDTTVAIDGGSGYADGYDVQIAKKIADELGMKLKIKKIAWDGLQPALESGEIDAIIAGMTADDEREKGADFTTPYYESEMVMIVRADDSLANATKLSDFSGKNIVGQISTTYDEVIDQIPNVNHVTPLKDYPSMIYALQKNTVDGITAELPVATGATEANKDLKIVHFASGEGFKADTSVSIALKEGTRDSDFFKKVQAALDNISDDTRQDIMLDAVKRQPASN